MHTRRLFIRAHNVMKFPYVGKRVEKKIERKCIETAFCFKKSNTWVGAKLKMLWSEGLYSVCLVGFSFLK